MSSDEDEDSDMYSSEDEAGWSDCSADGCWSDCEDDEDVSEEDSESSIDLMTCSDTEDPDFQLGHHPMIGGGRDNRSTSPSSPFSSDASNGVVDLAPVQKKSKKTRARRGTAVPDLLEWTSDKPTATQLERRCGKGNHQKLMVLSGTTTDQDNSKFAKVIDPKPGQEYIFTDVDEGDVTDICKRDLYKWRYQGSQNNYYEGLKRYNYYASTCMSETHTTLIKKVVLYNPITKRAHVKYEGDDKWGLIDPKKSRFAENEELPTGEKVETRPDLCNGTTFFPIWRMVTKNTDI